MKKYQYWPIKLNICITLKVFFCVVQKNGLFKKEFMIVLNKKVVSFRT